MENFDRFHDGFLDGLLIDGPNARVFLSSHDKQEFVLEVFGVVSLKVDGFRQGNIIFDVLVRDGNEVTIDDMTNFFEFEDEANAGKKLQEARAKNLIVLEINPSYGASCAILAESVALVPRIR